MYVHDTLTEIADIRGYRLKNPAMMTEDERGFEHGSGIVNFDVDQPEFLVRGHFEQAQQAFTDAAADKHHGVHDTRWVEQDEVMECINQGGITLGQHLKDFFMQLMVWTQDAACREGSMDLTMDEGGAAGGGVVMEAASAAAASRDVIKGIARAGMSVEECESLDAAEALSGVRGAARTVQAGATAD